MTFKTFVGLSFLLSSVFSITAHAALEGPKKRVTVMDFKDKSDIARMISAALAKSGKCLVIERAALMLTGVVKEFGVRHQDMNGGNSGIERETARCVLDLRFIDTTTGHVIAAEQAVGEASAHRVTDDADSPPSILLGQATRQVVDHAVALIEKHLSSAPWYGRIVKTSEGNIFVNTGIEDGRSVGDEFDVVRQGEALFDSSTGETLGTEKTPVGRIRLVAILGPRLARAVALDQVIPQTGDIIQ